MIDRWIQYFGKKGVETVYSENKGTIGGCGFAKNRCVEQSHGRFLCFQDAIKKQVEVLLNHPKALVGTHFE